MSTNKKTLIIGLGILFINVNTYSATAINLRHQASSLLTNFSLSPNLKTNLPDIEVIKKEIDFNQTTHIKIQQKYHGYPIWGANGILHFPSQKGSALSLQSSKIKMNGTLFENLDQDLAQAPSFIFTEQQAKKARDFVTNHYLGSSPKDKIIHGKHKLLIYVDQGKAHWAFKLDFLVMKSNTLPARPTYIIDALSFDTFKHWNEIRTFQNTEETNPADSSQPEKLESVKAGGLGGNLNGLFIYDGFKGNKPSLDITRDSKKAICYLKNQDVVIKKLKYDMVQMAPVGDVIQYKCDKPDPRHGNIYWNGMFDLTQTGGMSPANDALYAAQVINRFYQSIYNVPVLKTAHIDSIEDDDDSLHMMISINLHPDKGIFEDNQAAFDPISNELLIGDGDGEKFYPLTSVDVIAHELSHGFTHQHAGLINAGQSAGLDESFSDMASQAVQFFESQHNNWKIGASVMVDNEYSRKALRYMDNPRHDCIGIGKEGMCSIDNLKDYHEGINGHFSNGIFNKAFYLLSTAPNWNIPKAFDVMVQANMRYWVPTTNFTEAACGVLDATKDYGYDLDTVKNSFAAVGINTDQC